MLIRFLCRFVGIVNHLLIGGYRILGALKLLIVAFLGYGVHNMLNEV